jgi:hypothetical protein
MMIREIMDRLRLRRKRSWRYRSAITGKIVSQAYAEKNPETTIRERI